MLTPKEVAEHSFGKSSFSGYNMAAVDDFLDTVTADYETLYNDNTLLKQKLGVLSDKIREYQSTEEAMRRTLLTAQTMADEMVKDAESKRDALVLNAEADAQERMSALRGKIAEEELRLTAAHNATAAYVAQLQRLCEEQMRYIAHLDQISPPPISHVERVAGDIEDAVRRATLQNHPPVEEQEDPSLSDTQRFDIPMDDEETGLYQALLAQREVKQYQADPQNDADADPDATRRINLKHLEFGKNYETK